MADDAVMDIASALQSASIKRHPSPRHDINPSTAASEKRPVSPVFATESGVTRRPRERRRRRRSDSTNSDFSGLSNNPNSSTQSSGSSGSSHSIIPLSAIHPVPRRSNLPPLPDLRFEQSYLASIRDAKTSWAVAWITFRDQFMMPLLQGTGWQLLVFGWRHWNREVSLQGMGIGARVRRWWWNVNNWEIKPPIPQG